MISPLRGASGLDQPERQAQPLVGDAGLAQIVCGCDGKLYKHPCEAGLSGVGVATDGADRCAAPPGTFSCGTEHCTRGTQYCQRWYSNTVHPRMPADYVHWYGCGDLASGCGAAPTCGCVTATECGGCTGSAAGDVTAMCLIGGSDAGAANP